MLSLQDVSVTIAGKKILDGISFNVHANDFFAVMGPNGAGKTTVIRAIMRDVRFRGKISLLGKSIEGYASRDIARAVGVLSQGITTAQFPYNARQIISMGRYAHQRGFLDAFGASDSAAIDRAVELTSTGKLLDRNVQTLSGGEMQRVLLAKLLAQDPALLILDEPTNHLDFQHQIGTFDILRQWARMEGRAVMAIVHDFNITRAYATEALMLNGGVMYARGSPSDVLSRDNLRTVYSYDVTAWMAERLSEWTVSL